MFAYYPVILFFIFCFFIKNLIQQESEKSNELIVLDRKHKDGGERRRSDGYRQHWRIYQRWKQNCNVVLTYCFHFVRHFFSFNTKDKYKWLFHRANQNKRYMYRSVTFYELVSYTAGDVLRLYKHKRENQWSRNIWRRVFVIMFNSKTKLEVDLFSLQKLEPRKFIRF